MAAGYRRDEPLVIECALNGASRKETNPHVPISGEELLADMLAVFGAGAAIAHQHDAIGPEGTADDMAAMSLALYRGVLDNVEALIVGIGGDGEKVFKFVNETDARSLGYKNC